MGGVFYVFCLPQAQAKSTAEMGKEPPLHEALWHYQTFALTAKQPVFPYVKQDRATETQIKRLERLLLNKSDVRQESLNRAQKSTNYQMEN